MRIWIIAIAIFIFAVGLRMWNLGEAGRWSDEQALLEKGYRFAELFKKGDFNNTFWYKEASDHPPFAFYFYGVASYPDFLSYDENAEQNFKSPIQGAPIFNYDPTVARLVSIFVASLAVVLVFFIGIRYFSLFVGVTASLILASLPHYVGLTQFVVLESWVMLTFTACVFSFLLYLEKGSKWLLAVTGILTGVALEVKESNILIIPFYLLMFFVWKYLYKNKDSIPFINIIQLGIIALITCFIIWPMPWLHPIEYLTYSYNLWFKGGGLIPDVFFGRTMGARSYYYVFAVLITTPVLILLLTVLGGRNLLLSIKKNWIFAAVLLWFIVPFLMSFFHHRQHMVRYIVEFYAPLAIIAAVGFQSVVQYATRNIAYRYVLLIPLLLYLFIILQSMTPYYLAYFNELVGGTRNVYEQRLFLMGWFGEGLKHAGIYIANDAKPNAKIGMATNPAYTNIYQAKSLHYEWFNPDKKYDYVVVNYYNVIRSDFDESILSKDYSLVYTEKAGNIDYVHVYKRKKN